MSNELTFDERLDMVRQGFKAVFGEIPSIHIEDHPLDTEGDKCMVVNATENWVVWKNATDGDDQHVLEVAVYFPATRELPEDVDYAEVGKYDRFSLLLEALVANEAQKRIEAYLDSREIQSLAQEVCDEVNPKLEEGTDG